MKRIILSLFIIVMFVLAPRVVAQSTTNADFDPFPQMEQDINGVSNDIASASQQQNDDWPPANAEAEVRNGAGQ